MNQQRSQAAVSQFVNLIKQNADITGAVVIDKREKTQEKSTKAKKTKVKSQRKTGRKTNQRVSSIGKKRVGRNRPKERAIG